jgi:hypothetical protein
MPSQGSSQPVPVAIEVGAAPEWRMAAAPDAGTARDEAPVPPAAPPPVARQVAAAVAQAGSGDLEIRLDPPELGRVQIRLEAGEDGVRAVVLAERAETQELLRRNADQLARDLGAAGFARVSLDFAAGHEAPRRGDRHAAVFAATPPAEVGAAEALPFRRYSAGGLDIRI